MKKIILVLLLSPLLIANIRSMAQNRVIVGNSPLAQELEKVIPGLVKESVQEIIMTGPEMRSASLNRKNFKTMQNVMA